MTICMKCKNHLGGNFDEPWHQHFCKASPLEKKMNFVTGMVETIHGIDEYAFCRDINSDGECNLFMQMALENVIDSRGEMKIMKILQNEDSTYINVF